MDVFVFFPSTFLLSLVIQNVSGVMRWVALVAVWSANKKAFAYVLNELQTVRPRAHLKMQCVSQYELVLVVSLYLGVGHQMCRN